MLCNYLVLGAAALVAASPAPQAIDLAALDAIPVNLAAGPPVGVGVAQETAFFPSSALAKATAAASAPTSAQMAKRSAFADVEPRWWIPHTTPTPTPTTPAYNPSSTNFPPSTCTPVGWTNTYAFTSTTACPTAIEVGTYCGFINPLDPCAAQPNAYGPNTTPDTVDAFLNNPVYSNLALKAKTPVNYTQSFSNLHGSVSGAGYLGYKTLTSYDPAACSAYCDQTSTCTGFNIFIERDPKWNQDKCSCKSPSIAQIKCSIWGQNVTAAAATNTGGFQAGFEVVIVASNGYNKNIYFPPNPPSCTRRQDCGGLIHNHGPYCIGQKTFPGPWDPALCAAYATSQNQQNKKAGFFNSWWSLFGFNTGACVSIQAAYLTKDGTGFGTHCRLFTKSFPAWQADLDVGAVAGSSWGCSSSWTWDFNVQSSLKWNWKRDDMGNSNGNDTLGIE
ncbi:hypothetical protein ACEQ8H_006767 [Pleosporales sp. CAS-2024a]